MRRVLEYQADQIEMVLTSHRVPGRVMGGVVTPRWVSYQVLPEISTKVSRIMALSEELALRLGAQGVRVSRQGAAIQVDVPREDGQVVRLLNLCRRLKEMPKQTAMLGLDEPACLYYSGSLRRKWLTSWCLARLVPVKQR